MLEEQEFHQPIKVIIGPELFYSNNPMQLNVGNAQQFNRVICPSSMFQFYYLAFTNSKKFGDQVEFVKGLKDYGLVFTPVLISSPVNAESKKMIAELTQVVEICYPTELVRACGVRGRHSYNNGVERFIESLTVQVQSTAGWDWENFIEF